MLLRPSGAAHRDEPALHHATRCFMLASRRLNGSSLNDVRSLELDSAAVVLIVSLFGVSSWCVVSPSVGVCETSVAGRGAAA